MIFWILHCSRGFIKGIEAKYPFSTLKENLLEPY